MLGFRIIASSEYQELVSDKETLGDRVRFLEGKLSDADNALKTVEKKLQDALLKTIQVNELQTKLRRSHEVNTALALDLDQAQESVATLQKAIADVKRQLSESQTWAKELETQNQNQINTIAKFVAQCDDAERERNELTIEKGLLKANIRNYQQSVAIAVDNLSIEIKNIFGGD